LRLDDDPDRRTRRSVWMIWAGFTVALVWAWLVAPIRESTDAIPWLMKAPLIALYLMWPLWQGGRLVLQKMREAPLAAWQGRYYAFGNFQIRVLVDEDDRLLIVATDVLDALGIEGRGRQPSASGQLWAAMVSAQCQGRGNWLSPRWACRRGWSAALAATSHASRCGLRTQVSEPHRRMLERGMGN